MNSGKISVMLFVMAAGSIPAAAAENMMLDEIVVRGQKESPSQESLTMREVRESPARDMGEALKQVEGVNVVRKGAIANDVVLRGFQKDNINVLVDGVRLHGACPNRMDSPAFHYDFAQIEQVDIIKGPYDLSNPGGMGGVINAVTKKPKQGAAADLNLTYGSYKSVNGSAAASFASEGFDILAGYAGKYSDVPKDGAGRLITDIYPSASKNRFRPDALDSRAYDIKTYWGGAGVKSPEGSRMDLAYSYQDAEHVLYPYLLMDAGFDKTTIVNWDYKIMKVSERVRKLKFQAYWDKVEHVMDDSLRESSRPGGMVTRSYGMRSDADTETAGAKANAELAFGGGTLSGGADTYSRNWNVVNRRAMASGYAPLNMVPDATIVNTGFFAQYDRAVTDKIFMTGGARGDLAQAKTGAANAAAASGVKKNFSAGSANLRLTFKPRDGFELFAGAARGARLPDQKELFINIPAVTGSAKDTSGNPGLKATANNEADLGLKFSNDKFYVNASVFYSSLSDYINLRGFQAGTTQYLTYENVDAVVYGGELGSQVSLPGDFFLKAGASCAWGRNTTGARPLSEMPPLKGTAALRYDNSSFFIEAAENLSARQHRVDTALHEAKTAGWSTTDLKAGYTYKDLTLYAGVYNLFDKYYLTYLSYLRDPFASGMKVPENGRNFYVTGTLRL